MKVDWLIDWLNLLSTESMQQYNHGHNQVKTLSLIVALWLPCPSEL